ncbi:MAG: hypothetical protein H7249_03765 [Chitinophagaceae bacterium]|nr:hypothetical protein [Oligoflexus sp.]
MSRKLPYIVTLVSLLGLSTACKTAGTSKLDASVSQSIEEKWSYSVDLTKEIFFVFDAGIGDSLKATKTKVDTVEVGAKVNPVLSIGGVTLLRLGPTIEIKNLYERKLLNEIQLVREKDVAGTGDGQGLFVDANTVAADRLVNCKAQKVITEGASYAKTQGGAINFVGLGLSLNKETNIKMSASTDYVMSRGFYRLKTNMAVNDLLQLCSDIARSDVALQNLDTINETIALNFDNEARLMGLADDVARGKKVNNFQFHNIKYDYRIRARESGKIFFEVFPDTKYADPKLDIEVDYSAYGNVPQIDNIIQKCVSNCQNYKDDSGKHGLHGYGEKATVAQSQQYLNMISAIFAARALGIK